MVNGIWKKCYSYIAMLSIRQNKWYYFYAAILIALLFVVLPFYFSHYGLIKEDPISSKAKTKLYGEYEKIKPLAEVVLIKEEPFFKRGEKSGRLYYEFTTTLNGRQIFTYYYRQFTDNGWLLEADTTDIGKRTAYYKKGKILAHLDYKEQSLPGRPTKFSIFMYIPSNKE